MGNIYSQYTINIIKIMMIHLLYLYALLFFVFYFYFLFYSVLLGYLFFLLENMEKHFLYKQIPMKTKCYSDSKQQQKYNSHKIHII